MFLNFMKVNNLTGLTPVIFPLGNSNEYNFISKREKEGGKNLCLEEEYVRMSRVWSFPVRQRMRKDNIKCTKLLCQG